MNTKWTITSDKFLSSEQVSVLLDYLTEQRDLAIARNNDTQSIRDYYLIRGLLESGCRVSEFCALQIGDFNGHKLTVKCGKGGKPRTILLTKATSLMFQEWLTVRSQLEFSPEATSPLFPSRRNLPYCSRGVQKRVKDVFSGARLPEHLSVHSLRHTYCSLLLASGKVGIATVKENLGHHSISVTNLYAHAVGNLDSVELYRTPSSEKDENYEPPKAALPKNSNNLVKEFLRKAN